VRSDDEKKMLRNIGIKIVPLINVKEKNMLISTDFFGDEIKSSLHNDSVTNVYVDN
jgi:hypothetical protein